VSGAPIDDLGTRWLGFERRGPLGLLRIDRPERRNALTKSMYLGVRRAVELVDTDPQLHALIITGTGDVFCPGGDVALDSSELVPPGVDFTPFSLLRHTPVPVVAAVNGICQAGGALLVMLADVAVASDRASFRFPEPLRGFPETWQAAVLPAHVGVARARDLLLTARKLDASEALAIGLVARLVAHDQLEAEAEKAAYQLLALPPRVRAIMKNRINSHYGQIDELTFNSALGSDEVREGFAAFLENRPPSWTIPTAESHSGGDQ
jgi:enoyl-CoA hydratase